MILSSILCISVSVQGRPIQANSTDSLQAIIKAYSDSITSLSAKLDSIQSANKQYVGDGRYYKLFVTPTFYHSAAGKSLAISQNANGQDEIIDAVDQFMLQLYLKRPDLITNSENLLKKAGTIRNDVEKPAKQKIELTKKSDPVPVVDTPTQLPSQVVVKKPNFWKFNGEGNLQFLQNYITDNWYKGGESNYSMVCSVTLTANYNNKSRVKFDNKLEMKLGFQTSRDDTIHKFKANNDLIRYTGKLGLQATKKWYYTLQILAYTQFTQGLRSNDKMVYSDFMSPFNLNLGLGMDYSVNALKGRLTGSINLSALAFNFRYVDRKNLADRYGIPGNHRTMETFGSQLTVDLTWKIAEQLSWKTRLYGYTTYQRTQIEWENTINLQVSKYISANIFLHPRFDDSAKKDDKLGYLQFKEYSSLGFSYSF